MKLPVLAEALVIGLAASDGALIAADLRLFPVEYKTRRDTGAITRADVREAANMVPDYYCGL